MATTYKITFDRSRGPREEGNLLRALEVRAVSGHWPQEIEARGVLVRALRQGFARYARKHDEIRIDGKTLRLLLLMGGVEINPGPPKRVPGKGFSPGAMGWAHRRYKFAPKPVAKQAPSQASQAQAFDRVQSRAKQEQMKAAKGAQKAHSDLLDAVDGKLPAAGKVAHVDQVPFSEVPAPHGPQVIVTQSTTSAAAAATSSSPAVLERKGVSAKFAGKKSSAKAAADALVDSLRDQQDKVAGAGDADAERERERVLAKRREQNVREDQLYRAKVESVHAFLGRFPEFYILACRPEACGTSALPLAGMSLDIFQYRCDCSVDLRELKRPWAPHTILTVRVMRVAVTQFDVDEDEKRSTPDTRLPHQKVASPYPDRAHGVLFQVTVSHFDPFGNLVAAGPGGPLVPGVEQVLLDYETLLMAMSNRLAASGVFDVVCKLVMQFRARQTLMNINSFDYRFHSWMSDLVFTALLLLHSRLLCQSPSLLGIGADELRRHLFGALNNAGPAAGGTYVSGYRVSPKTYLNPLVPVADQIHQKAGLVAAKMRDATKFVADSPMAVLGACGHISGIIPTFPNVSNYANRVSAYVKRLCLTPVEPTPEGVEMANLVEQGLVHECERVAEEGSTGEEIYSRCVEHCKEKGYNPGDTHLYLIGARAALHCMSKPVLDRQTLQDAFPEIDFDTIERLAPAQRAAAVVQSINSNAVFFKTETLDPGALKPPRLIVAPAFPMRGFMHALLYDSQHVFFRLVGDLSIKGKDPKQQMEHLWDACTGAGYFYETDFTSMESNITPVQIRREGRVAASCVTGAAREAIRGVFEFFARTPTYVRGAWESLILPPMRLSGTEQTSFGNFVNNYIWVNSLLVLMGAAGGCPPGDMLHGYHLPRFFEGDDGLFATAFKVPKAVVDRALAALGARLKLDGAPDFTSLNFCGSTLSSIGAFLRGDGKLRPDFVPLKNPVEILSRAFSIFRPLDTNRGDAALITAKCLSYFQRYHGLPVAGPILHAYLNQASNLEEVYQAGHAVLHAQSGIPSDQAVNVAPLLARHFIDLYKRKPMAYITLYGEDPEWRHWLSNPCLISPETRLSCEGLSGIHCAAQVEWEREVVSQIEVDAPGPWTCEGMRHYWEEFPGVRAMTVKVYEDVREKVVSLQADVKAQQIRDQASVLLEKAKAKVDEWTAWLRILLFGGVGAVQACILLGVPLGLTPIGIGLFIGLVALVSVLVGVFEYNMMRLFGFTRRFCFMISAGVGLYCFIELLWISYILKLTWFVHKQKERAVIALAEYWSPRAALSVPRLGVEFVRSRGRNLASFVRRAFTRPAPVPVPEPVELSDFATDAGAASSALYQSFRAKSSNPMTGRRTALRFPKFKRKSTEVPAATSTSPPVPTPADPIDQATAEAPKVARSSPLEAIKKAFRRKPSPQ